MHTLTSDGVERAYLLGVPATHDGRTPVPLVVDLHGFGQDVRIHDGQTGMTELGRRMGFVTASPQGLGAPPALSGDPAGSDVRFIDELLDSLEAALCLDTSRVYVTGFSGGGAMAALLSCIRADRFAAVAPVGLQLRVADCEPSRPVPVLAMQSVTDPLAPPFDGGTFASALAALANVFGAEAVDAAVGAGKLAGIDPLHFTDRAPGVVEVVTTWAERNGCAAAYREDPITEHVRLLGWDDCPADGTVQLYVTDGAGHVWPGDDSDLARSLEPLTGPTIVEIDASELIWAYFRRHRL